jgi:hypothetical protein
MRAHSSGRVVPDTMVQLSMEQVPKSVAVLRAMADFTIDLQNAESGKLDIVTPGATWEQFRAQWYCESPTPRS